jgi:hypothetical protein
VFDQVLRFHAAMIDSVAAKVRYYLWVKGSPTSIRTKREYELTKHIPLVSLNPIALIVLKESGTCEIELTEALFNLDYPGHYMRHIKSVSITIRCATGPYTSVNCKLTLLKNTTRVKPLPGDSHRESDAGDTEDDPFRTDFSRVQSIATSSAQSDSGLFELNFRDERYLPFEGAGVISHWRIELAGKWTSSDGSFVEFPQFDFNSISDVILHLPYTARRRKT